MSPHTARVRTFTWLHAASNAGEKWQEARPLGLGEARARLVLSRVDITTVIAHDVIRRGDHAASCYTDRDRSASTAGRNVFR